MQFPGKTEIALFFLIGFWLAVVVTTTLRTGIVPGSFGKVRRATSTGAFWSFPLSILSFSVLSFECCYLY
jgi:hypothetical protein